MPWPALIGPALSLASGLLGKKKKGRRPAAAPAAAPIQTLVTRAIGAVGRPGAPGFRRRRKAGLTMGEMQKIALMAALLGRNNPAVLMTTMRALGGRL